MVLRYPLVLAIPAGGVPIGLGAARALRAPFRVAPVRKLQIPREQEAGFGAVTWDGTMVMHLCTARSLRLTEDEI